MKTAGNRVILRGYVYRHNKKQTLDNRIVGAREIETFSVFVEHTSCTTRNPRKGSLSLLLLLLTRYCTITGERKEEKKKKHVTASYYLYRTGPKRFPHASRTDPGTMTTGRRTGNAVKIVSRADQSAKDARVAAGGTIRDFDRLSYEPYNDNNAKCFIVTLQ